MTRFILFLLVAISFPCHAQQLKVERARNVSIVGGGRVKKGDVLSSDQTIRIKGNGEVKLWNQERWYIYLPTAGLFNLDSLFRKHKELNKVHDSIYTALETHGLLICNEPYKDKKEPLTIDETIVTHDGSVLLNWERPTKDQSGGVLRREGIGYEKGPFWILVQNRFDDFLALRNTTESHLQVGIAKHRIEGSILCKVFTEQCQTVALYAIIME